MRHVILLWGLVLLQVGILAVSQNPLVLAGVGFNLALAVVATTTEFFS